MSKRKIALVSGALAVGYPAGVEPAVYSSDADGDATLVMLVKVGANDTLEPYQGATEGTLEAVRALLASNQTQPLVGGHFVFNLVASTVQDFAALAGGIPANATGVQMQLEAGDFDRIRFTKDGSNPTASKGFLWRNSMNDEGFLILEFRDTTALAQCKFLLFEDPLNNGAIIQAAFTKAAN